MKIIDSYGDTLSIWRAHVAYFNSDINRTDSKLFVTDGDLLPMFLEDTSSKYDKHTTDMLHKLAGTVITSAIYAGTRKKSFQCGARRLQYELKLAGFNTPIVYRVGLDAVGVIFVAWEYPTHYKYNNFLSAFEYWMECAETTPDRKRFDWIDLTDMNNQRGSALSVYSTYCDMMKTRGEVPPIFERLYMPTKYSNGIPSRAYTTAGEWL